MFNKVVLVGNLTRDIELRYTPAGLAIAKTGLATNRKFKGQDGQQKEEVCFVDIDFFARSAEIANQYLRKGSKILVEGRLKLDQWVDQNGQKRSKHSVTVETMQMLDSRGDAQQGGYGQQPAYGQPQQPTNDYNQQQPMNDYNQGGYDAYNNNNAPSYSQPQTQQGGYGQQPAPEPKIPEIDVEEDEIPF